MVEYVTSFFKILTCGYCRICIIRSCASVMDQKASCLSIYIIYNIHRVTNLFFYHRVELPGRRTF